MTPLWKAALVSLVWAYILLSVSAKTCWYDKPYNTFHPSPANNRTDKEPLPSSVELTKICPNDPHTLTVRCYDSKGEYFTGKRNSTSNHYVATCTAKVGLVCNPYPGSGYTCPDFTVKFGCECPITTTTPVGKGTATEGNKSMRSGSDVMMLSSLPVALLLQAVSVALLLF